MARTLEQLRARYNSTSREGQRRAMPMPHGPRGPRRDPSVKGKPKNMKKTIARLLSYVGKHKVKLALVLICMLCTAVTSLIGSYMIAPIVDRVTLEVLPDAKIEMSAAEKIADKVITAITEIDLIKGVFENKFTAVSFYVFIAVCILAIIYVVSVVCSYVESRLMLSISQNSIEEIRNDLFKKLQKLPLKYFDTNPTGEVMSRFTNDIDNIDVMLNNSLTSVVSGIVTILGTFVFMVTTNIWLTLVTVMFIPVFIKGGALLGKMSAKYYVSQQAAIGALNGYVEETVSGQKVIKVFNHEEVCEEEFVTLNEDLRDKQMYAQFWGGVMGPIMGNVGQVSYALTVGLGGVLMFISMQTSLVISRC